MKLARQAGSKVRALLQIYGTSKMKQRLWDREFAEGKWACLDETSGDYVYSLIEKWTCGGAILDLGCGSGNTANGLRPNSYRKYTGIDISSIAIQKAIARSASNARSIKAQFVHSDVLTYIPAELFNVILFRESIYYIAMSKIAPLLYRYSAYLQREGVYIARMWRTSDRFKKILGIIKERFDIIETAPSPTSSSIVIVFRPRHDHPNAFRNITI